MISSMINPTLFKAKNASYLANWH